MNGNDCHCNLPYSFRLPSRTLLFILLHILLTVNLCAYGTNEAESYLRQNKNGKDSSETERIVATSNSTINEIESSITIVTHSSFDPDIRFCRIKGACRLGDGTVLLPIWMQDYSTHLVRCGFDSVQFAIVNEDNLYHVAPQEDEDVQSTITLKDAYRDFDVIGNDAPRGEPSLLAIDVTPSMLLLDLFSRPFAYQNVTKTLCTTAQGVKCGPDNYTDPLLLRPMLFIDSRISDTKDFHWPKCLLRLIRNSMSGSLDLVQLKDLYGWRLRSEASCFRSIVSTNAHINQIPPETLIQSHIFFKKNRLDRKNVHQAKRTDETCIVKILILNRYGKRYIEGSDKLRAAIISLGEEVRKRQRGITIQPEEVFFDKASFHEQVSVMQESDIVVATHGNGNANFMFLRPKARVFEIIPFGIRSDLYKNISVTYGSSYSTVVGQPDEEVFLACVKHFNPSNSEERQRFIKTWTQEAQKFKSETVQQRANIRSNYLVPDEENEGAERDFNTLLRLKQCASYQRITVDVKHLAKAVVRTASEQCAYTGDRDFLS